jgi:hypothetical protein
MTTDITNELTRIDLVQNRAKYFMQSSIEWKGVEKASGGMEE